MKLYSFPTLPMKRFSFSFLSATALMVPVAAFAQEAAEAAPVAVTVVQWGLLWAFLGAGLSTILSGVGSILGVSLVGQAGAGLLTEKPQLAGKVITLMVLPGSQGLYGMVISLLFIFNYGPLIAGDVTINPIQGVVLLAAFLPVTLSCLISAPYQAKICAAGLHMLAKDDKLTGRVITMAALVETYALLGFLISFFMLNSFRAGIIS